MCLREWHPRCMSRVPHDAEGVSWGMEELAQLGGSYLYLICMSYRDVLAVFQALLFVHVAQHLLWVQLINKVQVMQY